MKNRTKLTITVADNWTKLGCFVEGVVVVLGECEDAHVCVCSYECLSAYVPTLRPSIKRHNSRYNAILPNTKIRWMKLKKKKKRNLSKVITPKWLITNSIVWCWCKVDCTSAHKIPHCFFPIEIKSWISNGQTIDPMESKRKEKSLKKSETPSLIRF